MFFDYFREILLIMEVKFGKESIPIPPRSQRRIYNLLENLRWSFSDKTVNSFFVRLLSEYDSGTDLKVSLVFYRKLFWNIFQNSQE